jgi:hypothetical protein
MEQSSAYAGFSLGEKEPGRRGSPESALFTPWCYLIQCMKTTLMSADGQGIGTTGAHGMIQFMRRQSALRKKP